MDCSDSKRFIASDVQKHQLGEFTVPQETETIGFRGMAWALFSSVILPENVTCIEGYAFEFCKNMTEIRIPNGVTDIGERAFMGCCGLKSIRLPDSLSKISTETFQLCTELASVYIPDRVAEIEQGAFSNCNSIRDIVIPEHLAGKVKLITSMHIELAIHTPNVYALPVNYRRAAIVGFAKENPDLTTERAKNHLKFIKANTAGLLSAAVANPTLFSFMWDNKLIPPRHMELYQQAALDSGEEKLISVVHGYTL